MRKQLELRLKKTQSQIKKYYNPYHKSTSPYQLGIRVLLSSKNIRIKKPNKKLNSKFLNSFRIIKAIDKQTYRLNLPLIYSRFHNIFHISLLEPYHNKKSKILIILKSIPIEE
jgi:hypothetical protein